MDDIYITLEKVGNSWGRKLIVPEEFSIAGVEHDKNARCFRFRIPKLPEFFDMVDLSGLSCRVNYQHEYYDYAFQTDLMVEQGTPDDDYMVFRWVLGAECFPKAGTLSFILCCSLTGEDGIVKEWNSEIATVKVQKGLERDTQIIDQPDASTTGWATTARIADGAVTLEKLAEDVKDEFASLDEKITGAKEKAAQDDATLKKNIRDEYLNGIRYIGERFHGPCSRSGIEVMHITGKTTQERTNGYQLFDISKCQDSNSKGVKVYINPDGSYSSFPGAGDDADGWVAGSPSSLTNEEVKSLFHTGDLKFVKVSQGSKVISVMNFTIGDTMKIFLNSRFDSDNHNLTQDELDKHDALFGLYSYAANSGQSRSVKPMLYQDGDGTWEPFTGGKPGPNPDYPLPLKSFEASKVVCMGKNVFMLVDGVYAPNCESYSQLADGTIIMKAIKEDAYIGNVSVSAGYQFRDIDTSIGLRITIPEGASKVYLKSFGSVFSKNILGFIDKWDRYLGAANILSADGSCDILPDSAKLFVRIGKGDATAGQTYTDRVMVSFEPITEWVPPHYEEIELTEPLILRGLPDGTADEYIGDGMIVRRVIERTIDQTVTPESFFVDTTDGKAKRTFVRVKDAPEADGSMFNILSTKYRCIMGFNTALINDGNILMGSANDWGGTRLYFTIPMDVGDPAKLLAWLADNPFDVIYPLAVPVIETYPMPILPSWDDDVRAFFVSETETEIEWRPCPISDRSKDVQELKAAIEALN